MRCVTGHVALVFGLLSAAPAFTQNISAAAPRAASTVARVADVYVQAKKGVYVFNASSAGQLSLVAGSAFADSGQMEAVRGNALISVGTDYIHTYAIASNGGVGAQIGQIDTQDYGGSQCGNTDGAGSILDHTGQYLSVQLWGATDNNGNALCSAWQTYKIASNGSLAFLGDAVNTDQYVYQYSAMAVPIFTVSSNDFFDYGSIVSPDFSAVFTAYKRGSAGDLVPNTSFSVVNPKPKNGYSAYAPALMAADPNNHLAADVTSFSPDGTGLHQLASYTINNSTGAIQSTNTWANMPSTIANQAMAMSWAGNLLATSGQSGLQLFHFNGAAPATAYGAVLQPSVEFNQLAWDKSNHLYALNYSSGELYVYTVTPTSTHEVAGSPYKVPGAYGVQGLIVVPRS
jgi:hypothetical protein